MIRLFGGSFTSIVISLFFSFTSGGALAHPLDHRLTRAEVEERLQKWLIKSQELMEQIDIQDDEFLLYSSAEDKRTTPELPETSVKLLVPLESRIEEDSSESRNFRESLQGVKIALDPGHIGGALAITEARYIDLDLPREDGTTENIQFNEGTLTLATAQILARLLEAHGAEVLLTRSEVGVPVYSKSYEQWFAEDFDRAVSDRLSQISDPVRLEKERLRWGEQKNDADVFRLFYNPLDVQARAEMINRYQPDLTVMLHFNAGHAGRLANGKNEAHFDNRNMVFIPGSFMKGELGHAQARADFVRLLFSEDLSESKRLAGMTLESLVQMTGVPRFEGDYMPQSCLTLDSGVFARNLQATRIFVGPLVFGEAFYQENPEEARRLARQDMWIGDRRVSSRLVDVALGYYYGILNYLGVNHSQSL